MLNAVTERAKQGIAATIEEALELHKRYTTEQLCEAADAIRRARFGNRIDTCSIANARSGRCSENCKWCAQSRHWSTGIDEYDIIPLERAMELADASAARGVGHYSLVTSGRRVAPADIEKFCSIFRSIRARHPKLRLCASMGLLGPEALKALWEAGVDRYHCNLETSADYFPELCTTHTHADKLATIAAAREGGMEVCSGGIIGMGETPSQRIELALALRQVEPESIPINILCPIPGTPLENTAPLTPEEVLDTVAFFRFIHPTTTLRFAGGRSSLSRENQLKAIKIGMNGGVVGDLLTTIGSSVAQDKELVDSAGLKF